MAKDKEFEIKYKQQGIINMLARKNKRILKKKQDWKYSNDEYGCPNCGRASLHCYSNDNYGYICPKCKIEFETPDT